MSVPGSARRTAGKSTRSLIACDTVYFSLAKPKGPAIPQHPASRDLTSAVVLRSKASSSVILMIAL